MNFLPSKRFGLIVISILLAGGIVYSVLPRQDVVVQSFNTEVFKYTERVGQLVPVESPALKQASESDGDGDGLPDWEERLWKSDPTKKDTDGDGTLDGAEVTAGRNPIVKGPKDSVRETISLEASYQKDAAASALALTPTERVSREFFAKYLSMKQGGAPLTAKQTQELLVETVSLAAEESEEVKPFTEKNFSVSTNNTPDVLRLYGNTVGDSIRRHSFKTENEITLFEQVLEKNDLHAVTQLQNIADAYTKITNDLSTVTVPSSTLTAHIFLTTQMRTVGETIRSFAMVQEDPISSLVAFANYEERAAGLALAVRDIQNIFLEAGIVFEPNEPGYLFAETRPSL